MIYDLTQAGQAFADAVKVIEKEAGKDARGTFARFCLAVTDSATRNSRVDTGYLRSGWHVQEGNPFLRRGIRPRKIGSPLPPSAPGISVSQIEAIDKPIIDVFISKPVSYAIHRENKDRMLGGAVQLMTSRLLK